MKTKKEIKNKIKCIRRRIRKELEEEYLEHISCYDNYIIALKWVIEKKKVKK